MGVVSNTVRILALGIVLVLGLGHALARNDTIDRAFQLMRGGDYDAAFALLEPYTQNHPGDGNGWAALANAYHSKGDYSSALAANRRAAEFPHARPTAKYNEACALSLLGRVDDANRALQEAIAAGFLDFDLMASDTDLNALRAQYDLPLPPRHEYKQFNARNGVMLEYKVLLPTGFDGEMTYPAAVFFPPGPGPLSADWALSQLITESDDTAGWIVVYAVGPDRGWFTHPSHHALEDLLRQLQAEYKIEGGKFHAVGFGGGARVATTYSRMAGAYFQSLTTFSGWHWDRWDDDELGEEFRDIPVRLVVGADDRYGRSMNSRVQRLMAAGGVDAVLSTVDGDDYMLASVRHGKIFAYLPREDGGSSP